MTKEKTKPSVVADETEVTLDAPEIETTISTNDPELANAMDKAFSQINASEKYKIVPEIATGINVSEDPYFHSDTPASKIESIKKELGIELVPGVREDLTELYNHFREFFPARDGFKVFVNPYDVKYNGVPLTILVPMKYSNMDSEALALMGCHRVSWHIKGMSVQQVGEDLEKRYKQVLGILKKYRPNFE